MRTASVLVVAGSAYLLVSMLVALQRQRHGVLLDAPISMQLTVDEIHGCFDELRDVSVALEKHLENAYHLLGGYDSAEAQRWSAEGEFWRKRWRVFGERCRLAQQPVPSHKDLEAMAAAYQELGSIQITYSRELLRFGSELAPCLDRIHKRVDRIGEDLAQSSSSAGAKQ